MQQQDFKLAEECRYIQQRAADRDSRVVAIAQLLLFSSESGDAWLLDPTDQSAVQLARAGDFLPVHIEETDTSFAIAWAGHYQIDGEAFDFYANNSGRAISIVGYPIQHIQTQIFNMLGEP